MDLINNYIIEHYDLLNKLFDKQILNYIHSNAFLNIKKKYQINNDRYYALFIIFYTYYITNKN